MGRSGALCIGVIEQFSLLHQKLKIDSLLPCQGLRIGYNGALDLVLDSYAIVQCVVLNHAHSNIWFRNIRPYLMNWMFNFAACWSHVCTGAGIYAASLPDMWHMHIFTKKFYWLCSSI